MDDATIIQRGLDLLNLMTMDPEGIWAAVHDEHQAPVEQTLQHISDRAEAIQHEQDAGQMLQAVVALAGDVLHLVNETPELRALLLPEGIDAFDDPQVLSAWKPDLGDTENEQRARAQKFAAQMHNSLVLIRQATPPRAAPVSPSPVKKSQQ
jgi:hypothetical protein